MPVWYHSFLKYSDIFTSGEKWIASYSSSLTHLSNLGGGIPARAFLLGEDRKFCEGCFSFDMAILTKIEVFSEHIAMQHPLCSPLQFGGVESCTVLRFLVSYKPLYNGG